MSQEIPFKRVVLIVLDSVGIGEMPDSARYGDAGADTVGHVLGHRHVQIPNLSDIGLCNIRPLPIPGSSRPSGSFGKAATRSNGKDTTTGHWEMSGLVIEHAFPTYADGFPPRIIDKFEQAIGRKVLGNKAASGTEIIKELGEEHVRTGRPIVYTSADSVFQVATHVDVVPLERLYDWCRIARGILDGDHRVGRVIARPFAGTPGAFVRTPDRRDFSVPPPGPTVLDACVRAG